MFCRAGRKLLCAAPWGSPAIAQHQHVSAVWPGVNLCRFGADSLGSIKVMINSSPAARNRQFFCAISCCIVFTSGSRFSMFLQISVVFCQICGTYKHILPFGPVIQQTAATPVKPSKVHRNLQTWGSRNFQHSQRRWCPPKCTEKTAVGRGSTGGSQGQNAVFSVLDGNFGKTL